MQVVFYSKYSFSILHYLFVKVEFSAYFKLIYSNLSSAVKFST